MLLNAPRGRDVWLIAIFHHDNCLYISEKVGITSTRAADHSFAQHQAMHFAYLHFLTDIVFLDSPYVSDFCERVFN